MNARWASYSYGGLPQAQPSSTALVRTVPPALTRVSPDGSSDTAIHSPGWPTPRAADGGFAREHWNTSSGTAKATNSPQSPAFMLPPAPPSPADGGPVRHPTLSSALGVMALVDADASCRKQGSPTPCEIAVGTELHAY